MKAITNAQLTNQLEQRLESQLPIAVTVFQNMSEELLLRASTSGGWSIAQCLAHLNTYSNYYLPIIKTQLDKSKEVPAETFFKSGWLGNYFIQLMEPATAKGKMKAAKQHLPSANINAHKAVAEFIQHQETMLSYLQLAKTRNLNNACIPVSIAKLIKLRIGDTFLFLAAHNQRHIEQAKRNL